VIKIIRQRQFDFLGYVMRRRGLEDLKVTEKIEKRRDNGRQRLRYLDGLCASWKDNVSPTQQLIRASEDRVLWHRMVANVVSDGTAHKEESSHDIFPRQLSHNLPPHSKYVAALRCKILVI